MNKEGIREQFRKTKKYKSIGLIVILFTSVPMVFLGGTIKYIAAVIIFGLGVYIELQYKCPACGYVFDTRMSLDDLIYCPKCSERLQD